MSQPTVIRREVRVRSTFGQIVKWIFIGFNILMLVWMVSGMMAVGNVVSGATSGAAQAGAAIGGALGFGMILSIWAFGDIILGLFVLLTRGEKIIIEESGSASPSENIQGALRPAVAVAEKKKNPVLIGIMATAGVVILLAIIGSMSKSGPQTAPDTATASTDNTPAPQEVATIKVSSQALAAAYSANEVSAQKQYGDQTLDVTGIVEGVVLDITNSPVVHLNGANPFLAVQASFDKSAGDQLASISKGQVLTVRCTSITSVISAPMLSGCTLPPPSKPAPQESNQVAASAPPAPAEEPAANNAPKTAAPESQTAITTPQAPASAKPSFDCAVASNAAERMVCSNSQLAALDVEITSLYRAARSAAADPSVIVADQRQWMDERNQCGSMQCLADVYNRRKTELAEWVGPNP